MIGVVKGKSDWVGVVKAKSEWVGVVNDKMSSILRSVASSVIMRAN